MIDINYSIIIVDNNYSTIIIHNNYPIVIKNRKLFLMHLGPRAIYYHLFLPLILL